jgi:hypothetical protein
MHNTKTCLLPGLFVCLWMSPGSILAQLNLPQTAAHVQLDVRAAASARESLADTKQPAELPTALQQEVVRNLPQDFASACRAMIQPWGTEAQGTDSWSVRILQHENNTAWVVFRCSSTLAVYAENYDERLAMLNLAAGMLDFVPLAPNLENDSDLYHFQFNRTLLLPQAVGVAFDVSVDNNNPCCDGGDHVSSTRLILMALTPSGPKEVLDIIVGQDYYSHDDVDGDSETIYKAELDFEHDSEGHIPSVKALYREETKQFDLNGHLREDQPPPRTGTEIFRWDAASLRFVKAAPDFTGKH